MTEIPSPSPITRPLGTMVAYGFPRGDVAIDLEIVAWLQATHLEILPDWRSYPDAASLRDRVADLGLVIHSAHGCWGGQAIKANRVNLSDLDPTVTRASRDDLKRCVDWLADAGGSHLVVHPGGFSDPEQAHARRAVLGDALLTLADHARGTGVFLCVENMPPGVHPGSRMADLTSLIVELDQPELALALDTGHAHLGGSVCDETTAAGKYLRTTHVHDNQGRQDSHLPPGLGTIDWQAWVRALDEIGYEGPVMLECIRYLRENPECLSPELRSQLDRLVAR